MNEFAKKRIWGPTPKYPLVEAYNRKSDEFKIIAGPCSIESIDHAYKMADIIKNAGATHFRGGVFRAGTFPSSNKFGYVETEIINHYHLAAKINSLKNVIEVLDYSQDQLDMVATFCDVFQVGARSMQNYTLLKKLGEYRKPVFLKRAAGATLDEFLGAAEHLLVGGVEDLTLIERGGASIHNHVRWDLSISMIPTIQRITEIPIVVDASHGTGRRDIVTPMTLAGIAAGADGFLVEVHEDPEKSLSDAEQAIDPFMFGVLMKKIKAVRSAIND